MEIRRAFSHEIDNLIAMRTAFIKEEHPSLTPEQILQHEATIKAYLQKHLDHDFWGYFAESDGQIAAVVYLVIQERPANPRLLTGKIGQLLNVYTKPAYRHRGLATALIQEALADAERFGASIVELQATAMGRPVYEKLGFKVAESSYTPMEYRFIP